MDVTMLRKVLLFIAFFFSLDVGAANEYVFAKLISEDELRYPLDARRAGYEGWAYYSYTIGVDGLVKDVQIVDSSGVKTLNRALIRHIESKVFEPATLDGKQVEESSGTLKTRFTLTNMPRAARGGFYRRYKRAKVAVSEERIDELKSIVDELENTSHRNLYEELYLQSLNVAYFNAIGESDRGYLHTQRVLDFYVGEKHAGSLAENEYYTPFLVIAYQYEVNAMRLGDALKTAALLSRIAAPDNHMAKKVLMHSNQLAKRARGKQFSMTVALVEPVYGDTSSRLVFRLLNKKVELSDVVGELNDFRVLCEHGYAKLQFTLGENWKIPNSWGRCDLHVEGQVGTTFTLTELPN